MVKFPPNGGLSYGYNMGLDQANSDHFENGAKNPKLMKRHLGTIKNNIASQTFPDHRCKCGTFVQKITLYTFFATREPSTGSI